MVVGWIEHDLPLQSKHAAGIDIPINEDLRTHQKAQARPTPQHRTNPGPQEHRTQQQLMA